MEYTKHFPIVKFQECGFFIDITAPFLGATPDRLLEEDGSKGVFEVKCPFKHRLKTIADACNDKDFYLEKRSSGIKGQMAISERQWSHFTERDFVFHHKAWDSMKRRLEECCRERVAELMSE